MTNFILFLVILATVIISGCQETQIKESNVIEISADRNPPPHISPVETNGVRFEQAINGHDVGVNQVGGVLVATDVSSGKRLWTLAVYENTINPNLEADVQWVHFKSLTLEPDGRLRIVNEEDKTFLVDVKARTVFTTNK